MGVQEETEPTDVQVSAGICAACCLPYLTLDNSFPLLFILAAALGPPLWQATASFELRSSTRESVLRLVLKLRGGIRNQRGQHGGMIHAPTRSPHVLRKRRA